MVTAPEAASRIWSARARPLAPPVVIVETMGFADEDDRVRETPGASGDGADWVACGCVEDSPR